MSKKKEIPPFKMLPVELREHLHELTGNELKVWLCLYLHSDKDKEAFPSNDLLMRETGMTHTTLAFAKRGLRSKGWMVSQQRYRENGSLSTMVEKIVISTFGVIPEIQADTIPNIGDMPPQESGISPDQNSGIPEVDTLEVDTGKPDTSKPEKLISQLASQLVETPSASIVSEQLKSLETVPLQQVKTSPEFEQRKAELQAIVADLGNTNKIPLLLGFAYFASVHDEAMYEIARVLVARNRSIHWLECMVKWIKEHKFWSTRIHTGERGLNQLAKHMMNLELCEQFDAHISLKQGADSFDPHGGNAYLLHQGWSPVLVKTASAGFDLQDAE
jgi:hypothetical protein